MWMIIYQMYTCMVANAIQWTDYTTWKRYHGWRRIYLFENRDEGDNHVCQWSILPCFRIHRRRIDLADAQHRVTSWYVMRFIWLAMGSIASSRAMQSNAMIKNRCKKGDHYWVDVTISPQVDANGKAIGHFAVRRKPTREQIEEAKHVIKFRR